MGAMTGIHSDNIVIGSGELYIDLLDDAGKPTGERYLGDSPGASLSVSTERVTVTRADGPIRVRLVDRVRSIERSLSLILHDISAENLALFVAAPAPTEVAARAAGRTGNKAQVIVPSADRWFALGQPDELPLGVGGGVHRRRQKGGDHLRQ